MFDFEFLRIVLKTTAMLFVVIGLLVCALYAMKKYFYQKRGTRQNDLVMQVVSTLHLSQKEKISVIDISGEQLVLGITPGRINLLTKLKHPDTGSHQEFRIPYQREATGD